MELHDAGTVQPDSGSRHLAIATSTTSIVPPPPSSSGISVGAIAGIVAGIVVVLGLCVYFLPRKVNVQVVVETTNSSHSIGSKSALKRSAGSGGGSVQEEVALQEVTNPAPQLRRVGDRYGQRNVPTFAERDDFFDVTSIGASTYLSVNPSELRPFQGMDGVPEVSEGSRDPDASNRV
ncbi:UNVERIFIED_CONTAM: hypothetical protein HDU68_011903 [Siphonaria sp. JEL0065]|nr:hypothetical protein HDU68_011903 [Siphonaria sp. JEL0065]